MPPSSYASACNHLLNINRNLTYPRQSVYTSSTRDVYFQCRCNFISLYFSFYILKFINSGTAHNKKVQQFNQRRHTVRYDTNHKMVLLQLKTHMEAHHFFTKSCHPKRCRKQKKFKDPCK